MKEKTEDEIGEIICQICDCVNYELDKARTKFPSFNSAHEGYAVLLEETDELWQEIKQKNQNIKKNEKGSHTGRSDGDSIRFGCY